MNIGNIFAGNSTAMHNKVTTRFRAGVTPHANPVFQRDSFSTGRVASQFQTYFANQSRNVNWCISNYYSVPPEEVMPLLNGIRQEIDNINFIGMTDIEIYDWIENKFVETFGKDFMMAHHLSVIDPINNNAFNAPVSQNYMSIGSAFESIITWQLYHQGDKSNGNQVANINRQRLFGSMSNDEIMETVRARFPENGMLLNRHVTLMLAELRAVGVIDAGFYYINEGSTFEQTLINWSNDINKPFNPATLLQPFNDMWQTYQRDSDLSLSEAHFAIRDFFVRHLGAIIGSNGFLRIDSFDW